VGGKGLSLKGFTTEGGGSRRQTKARGGGHNRWKKRAGRNRCWRCIERGQLLLFEGEEGGIGRGFRLEWGGGRGEDWIRG